jgi:hypothetical protein
MFRATTGTAATGRGISMQKSSAAEMDLPAYRPRPTLNAAVGQVWMPASPVHAQVWWAMTMGM